MIIILCGARPRPLGGEMAPISGHFCIQLCPRAGTGANCSSKVKYSNHFIFHMIQVFEFSGLNILYLKILVIIIIIYFSWVDSLFWLGCRRDLEQTDLYAHPGEASSEKLLKTFNQLRIPSVSLVS